MDYLPSCAASSCFQAAQGWTSCFGSRDSLKRPTERAPRRVVKIGLGQQTPKKGAKSLGRTFPQSLNTKTLSTLSKQGGHQLPNARRGGFKLCRGMKLFTREGEDGKNTCAHIHTSPRSMDINHVKERSGACLQERTRRDQPKPAHSDAGKQEKKNKTKIPRCTNIKKGRDILLMGGRHMSTHTHTPTCTIIISLQLYQQ